jgi:hypothetical protein
MGRECRLHLTPAQDGQSTSLDTGIKEGRKGSLPIYRNPCPCTRASNDGCLNQGSRAYYRGPAAALQRLMGGPVGLPTPKECHPSGFNLVVRPPCAAYIAIIIISICICLTRSVPRTYGRSRYPATVDSGVSILRSPAHGPSRLVLGTTTSHLAPRRETCRAGGCGRGLRLRVSLPHFGKILPIYTLGPPISGLSGSGRAGGGPRCSSETALGTGKRTVFKQGPAGAAVGVSVRGAGSLEGDPVPSPCRPLPSPCPAAPCLLPAFSLPSPCLLPPHSVSGLASGLCSPSLLLLVQAAPPLQSSLAFAQSQSSLASSATPCLSIR